MIFFQAILTIFINLFKSLFRNTDLDPDEFTILHPHTTFDYSIADKMFELLSRDKEYLFDSVGVLITNMHCNESDTYPPFKQMFSNLRQLAKTFKSIKLNTTLLWLTVGFERSILGCSKIVIFKCLTKSNKFQKDLGDNSSMPCGSWFNKSNYYRINKYFDMMRLDRYQFTYADPVGHNFKFDF